MGDVRLNIILVNIWLNPQQGGGTAERTRQLALNLARLGCKCTIVAMGSTPWSDEFKQANVDLVLVDSLGRRYPLPLINFVGLFRLIRKADIVHIMGFWFPLAAASSALALISGTPSVLCPAGSLTRFGRSSWIKRFYYVTAGQWMLSSAASIIATTHQEQALLLSDFSIAASSVFISPNGIGPPPPTSVNVHFPNDKIILFVGRLNPIKGADILLEAFASVAKILPDTLLILSGPDEGQRKQLQKRVAELKLEKCVLFTGFVDEFYRTALLSRASILAVPSHTEVMSMVALEAGAVGVPVILTDKCGFDEVQEIGGGLVVKAEEKDLSEALLTMLSDDVTRKEMGKRLREFVVERYCWRRVSASLLEHLAGVQMSRR